MVSKLNTTDLLAYGLVGCWKLKEGSGLTAYDLTSNGNNGTLIGGFQLGDPIGLKFDGVDDYVSVPDATSLNATTQLSIYFGIKYATLSSTHRIMGKWDYIINGSWGVQTGTPIGANEIGVFILNSPTDGGYQYGKTTDANFIVDTHYDISVVYNGAGATNADRLKIFVNAVQKILTFVGTIPSSLVNSTPPIRIGKIGELGQPFNGSIDEVRIWDRALSDAEVLELYNDTERMFRTKQPVFSDAIISGNEGIREIASLLSYIEVRILAGQTSGNAAHYMGIIPKVEMPNPSVNEGYNARASSDSTNVTVTLDAPLSQDTIFTVMCIRG